MSPGAAPAEHIRIVVMPGDTRFNLGDIAICWTITRMILEAFPGAEITVWGKHPFVDGGFEHVVFQERMGPGVLRALLRADLIVWGGGQLLQGNRSAVKIPFWAARILFLRLLRKRIVGLGHGVGPLPRRTDRWLTRIAVSCTEVFTVRDQRSLLLLRETNIPFDRVHLTADPALVLAPRVSDRTAVPPREGPAVPRPVLGLSLRYTRHHRAGRIVPFQLLPASLRRRVLKSADFRQYLEAVTEVCDRIVERLGVDLLLVPMYYAQWETDWPIARAIEQHIGDPDRVRILQPQTTLMEVVGAIGSLDAFVGTPMHSTLFSTSQYVPTLALYYEPKGLEYFSQIAMQRWALPLESLYEPRGCERLVASIERLWAERHEIRRQLEDCVPRWAARAQSNLRHLEAVLAAPARA